MRFAHSVKYLLFYFSYMWNVKYLLWNNFFFTALIKSLFLESYGCVSTISTIVFGSPWGLQHKRCMSMLSCSPSLPCFILNEARKFSNPFPCGCEKVGTSGNPIVAPYTQIYNWLKCSEVFLALASLLPLCWLLGLAMGQLTSFQHCKEETPCRKFCRLVAMILD